MSLATKLMIEANQLMAQAHNAMADALRAQTEEFAPKVGRAEAYSFDVDESMKRFFDQTEQNLKSEHMQARHAAPCDESLRQRAEAWERVFETLQEVRPGWIGGYETATEAAVRAIREMADSANCQSPRFVTVTMIGGKSVDVPTGSIADIHAPDGQPIAIVWWPK